MPSMARAMSEGINVAGPERDVSEDCYYSRIMDESSTPHYDWRDFCALEEIPDGDVLMRREGGKDLLVYRNGPQVTCLPNYCPHRGYTFDGGSVQDGVLMCPHHGYEFRLDTGECLTFAGFSLDPYLIRIRDGRVEVRLESAEGAERPEPPGSPPSQP